jgi:hypothetical protein
VNPMSGTGSSEPEGTGGRKPSRGWETLKAERTGCGSPGQWTSRAHVAVGAKKAQEGCRGREASTGSVR